MVVQFAQLFKFRWTITWKWTVLFVFICTVFFFLVFSCTSWFYFQHTFLWLNSAIVPCSTQVHSTSISYRRCLVTSKWFCNTIFEFLFNSNRIFEFQKRNTCSKVDRSLSITDIVEMSHLVPVKSIFLKQFYLSVALLRSVVGILHLGGSSNIVKYQQSDCIN